MLGWGLTHPGSFSGCRGGALNGSSSEHPGSSSQSAPTWPLASHTPSCFSGGRRICRDGGVSGERSCVRVPTPSPMVPLTSPQAGCSSRSRPGDGNSGRTGAWTVLLGRGKPGSSPQKHLRPHSRPETRISTRACAAAHALFRNAHSLGHPRARVHTTTLPCPVEARGQPRR